MDENSINIINTRYHKHMTDRHLAQVNFTAEMPSELWDKYIGTANQPSVRDSYQEARS